jgi:pimeloyl-ACP methyl ester carboxylesterase
MHLTRRHLIGLAAALPATATTFTQATPVPGVPPYETIAVGDIEIGYSIEGDGEPLLLIMGFTGTMTGWDPNFIAALTASYRVITFDNRGIGATTGTGPYPFTQLADDVAGLIDTLGFGQVSVFGWSLGAMIALDLVIRHRERVRQVILHSGDIGGTEAVTASGDLFATFVDQSGTEEEVRQRQIEHMFPAEWVEDHYDYIEWVFSRPALPVSPQAILLQGNALLGWYSQSHAVASVRVPTLILHGTDDLVIPVANAQLLADAIAGSWLIRLPGGHGVHYQYPREIGAMTHLFLQSGA